jgi:hypothetical protein
VCMRPRITPDGIIAVFFIVTLVMMFFGVI